MFKNLSLNNKTNTESRGFTHRLFHRTAAFRPVATPRFSLPLALLLSVLQNSPVADTRAQAPITVTIAPEISREIAGSGARDANGNKQLLHRICAPAASQAISANKGERIDTEQSGAQQLALDTEASARNSCGGGNAYILKTPLTQAKQANGIVTLTFVSL